jgi:hypothetical protein
MIPAAIAAIEMIRTTWSNSLASGVGGRRPACVIGAMCARRVCGAAGEIEIDASGLVIGDVVLLRAGERISADMQLFTALSLSIDASTLTGGAFFALMLWVAGVLAIVAGMPQLGFAILVVIRPQRHLCLPAGIPRRACH